ncbi:ATP-binding protein [Planctomycetota bacterium]
MLKRESVYAFMESNFDYLLVVDNEEHMLHVNQLFNKDYFHEEYSLKKKCLNDVLTSSSLRTFRSAMAQAREGVRSIALCTLTAENSRSMPLKAGYADTESGEIFLFFGNRLEGLSKEAEWEKDERIKELACLYRATEWIEVSSSIDEFFTNLPQYLSPGMLYPEEVVVYSVYEGVEYGQKPSSDNFISVTLTVGKQDKGEIRVGYLDDKHEILPEEQKMLDEIGRTLILALERKELRDKINLMQAEKADYNQRLRELKSEIAARTNELKEQKNNLSVVNSSLYRVSQGWQEAKVRLETMFKAIPDEVVLIDKNRKIVMTNQENVEPGAFCYSTFFDRNQPCEDCRLARILRDKTPVTLTLKRDDRYMQVHALPVYNQDQEVDGILEFYRDITLEKTYDQQLQQADKLASLGQLVSGIGHEINNPNQFIRGNIKIVKQSLEDMLPIVDEYHKSHPDLKIAKLKYDFLRDHIMVLVNDMASGSERIKGIVEGLRSFTKKDEGLLVDNVDINTLIEASVRLVYNEVHKRADIQLDLAENLPTFIGNSQKIEQVLVNLIVNASQAMHDGIKGLITIGTKTDGKDLIVKVEDNGIGMNQKTMRQICDPFFTTKRSKGGTGLGLSIAYRIIEEHGGNISVTSKPREGAKFTIRIPTETRGHASAKRKQ